MHGAKGEESNSLKHVAVAEFDEGPKGEHAGHERKNTLQTRWGWTHLSQQHQSVSEPFGPMRVHRSFCEMK